MYDIGQFSITDSVYHMSRVVSIRSDIDTRYVVIYRADGRRILSKWL